MELSQALAQVSEIREHLARTEVFRGYRSLTVGFSGVVGLTAAIIQAACLPRGTENVGGYLTLWGVAAAVNIAVVSIEMGLRAHEQAPHWRGRKRCLPSNNSCPALRLGCW